MTLRGADPLSMAREVRVGRGAFAEDFGPHRLQVSAGE
jgi:hypothetical protein